MLELYRNIKKYRIQMGLSQDELAKNPIMPANQKMPVLAGASIFPVNTGFFNTNSFYDYTMIL